MRVGIVPSLSHAKGGVYQYCLTILKALYNLQVKGLLDDEFVIFQRGESEADLSPFREAGWEIVPLDAVSGTAGDKAWNVSRHILGNGRMQRLAARLYSIFTPKKTGLPDPDRINPNPTLAHFLREQGIDWMLYPTPNPMSFETGLPYVTAVHDLQHRLHPEFPEVAADGRRERREYLFCNANRHAMLILVDSETGREDVLACYGEYGVTADKIKVLPFLPAPYLSARPTGADMERVRSLYNLPERYLFYPSQFWPHKNHLRIVQALSLLKVQQGLIIDIVFTGGYDDDIREQTFREVTALVKKAGLESNVHYLDYVPDENMAGLYVGATALIIPTFFGPTNIPPLEAWALDCPVITSDIRGIREQMGDAAVLVDPTSVEAIAGGIQRLWTNDKLRRVLIEKGRQRLKTYGQAEFENIVLEIVEEADRRLGNSQIKAIEKTGSQ